MNEILIWGLALGCAGLGLIWATIRLGKLYRAVLDVWPEWEGRRSLVPFWLLLLLGVALAAGATLVALEDRETPTSPSQESTYAKERLIAQLNSEIERLKSMLKESTKQIDNSSTQPPTPPSTAPPAEVSPNDVPKEETESPEKNPPTEVATTVPPASPPPAAPAAGTPTVDPKISALNEAVLNAVISGSMKPLEPIIHPTLHSQLTVDPIAYSRLQISLKQRLADGYRPTYLDSLSSPTSTTYIWKIKTVTAGPDILQRLAVSGDKVLGFHFDGLR